MFSFASPSLLFISLPCFSSRRKTLEIHHLGCLTLWLLVGLWQYRTLRRCEGRRREAASFNASLTPSSLAGSFAMAVPYYKSNGSYLVSPVVWLELFLGSDNGLPPHAALNPGCARLFFVAQSFNVSPFLVSSLNLRKWSFYKILLTTPFEFVNCFLPGLQGRSTVACKIRQ